MHIKWLRLSLMDLDEIFEYIAKDNPAAASETIDKIWEGVQILKNYPNSGREGRVPGTRELYIKDTHYILPYRVNENNIEILRALHTSKNRPEEFYV